MYRNLLLSLVYIRLLLHKSFIMLDAEIIYLQIYKKFLPCLIQEQSMRNSNEYMSY